jgi:glycerol uptake facilitator-like aquaporin
VAESPKSNNHPKGIILFFKFISQAILYILVQLVAGICAASVAYGLCGSTFSPGKVPCFSITNKITRTRTKEHCWTRFDLFVAYKVALGAEIIYTFALVTVMLNVATTKSQVLLFF